MKIEEQVLSREQMAHLKELGVDTSDASMAWFMSPKTKQWKIKVKNNFSHELLLRLSPERYIPTYTIGDLIVKVPKKVGDYKLKMDFDIIEVDEEMRQTLDSKCRKLADDLYNILCWVAENHKELIK